jgi:hypothetical protein
LLFLVRGWYLFGNHFRWRPFNSYYSQRLLFLLFQSQLNPNKMTSLLRKEKKFRKHTKILSHWKKYILEAVHLHCNRCDILYLPIMDYHCCIIAVSSVAITNAIRTLIHYDYIEINSIIYIIANEYSNLNAALFAVLLVECLPSNIIVSFYYCHRIYLRSPELFDINAMSYSISLLCRIKLHQQPVISVKLR